MPKVAQCVRKVLSRRPLVPHNQKKTISTCKRVNEKLHVGSSKDDSVRFNPMNIQMLPKNLYEQIFKVTPKEPYQEQKIERAISELKKFDLGTGSTETIADVEFKIPKLHGKDINEHFKQIAIEQCEPYVKSLLRLCKSGLPPKPKVWCREQGWTHYMEDENGCTATPVQYPPDDAMIFDCEVLVSEGFSPVMATAASQNSWYSWCSPRIFSETRSDRLGIESLIPLEKRRNGSSAPSKSPRVIIGHNVSYDRVRVKEQYFIEESGVRFIDTMSMHIAVSGFANEQRVVYKSTEKTENDSLSYTWLDAGSMNSLSDVHKFYCGSKLQKTARDIFVTGSMTEVADNFDMLMDYCSGDVQATFNVTQKLFPKFCARFPHPVTMAAMLEMSTMYLPTNKNWKRYLKNSVTTYRDLDREMKSTLMDIANNACQLFHGEKFKTDPWLWNLDWSIADLRLLKHPRKGIGQYEYKNPSQPDKNSIFNHMSNDEKRFFHVPTNHRSYTPSRLMQTVLDTHALLPKVYKHMPGYPKWYAELCMKHNDANWKPGPVKLSTLTRTTPKLLRMTWNGYALHHNVATGWGCLVPENGLGVRNSELSEDVQSLDDVMDTDSDRSPPDTTRQMGVEVSISDIPSGYRFFKLPHKAGNDFNVGSPLSHEFLSKMDEGILKSAHEEGANRCLEINQASSYWRLSRKRILSQIFMSLPDEHVPEPIRTHPDYIRGDLGVILPLTVVFGTISRRGVEPTWLTASNVRAKSIGSELKGMIQTPPGFSFVGADVDSQELWIASLLADAGSAREHGCTPLSWMTLQGTKSEGTDLHSKTARSIGISRDEAKVFNYARIYGSGEKATRQMLKRHQPGISDKQATLKVSKLFRLTKGRRKYVLSTDGRYYAQKLRPKLSPDAAIGGLVSYDEVQQLASLAKAKYGHLVNVNERDLVVGRVWHGGMESEMFNRLEQTASSMNPCTPFLGSRITTALEPSRVQQRYLPTRMNWVVQSSAVDYMHLMLACMRWLIKQYSIKARFSISIHDELRYICADEDRHRTALALQISNLLTRAMFSYQVGIDDLPLSVAFFSSVEIDKALRKHHLDDSITPSNPLGLKGAFGIGAGASLDIHEILKKTNGGSLEMESP